MNPRTAALLKMEQGRKAPPKPKTHEEITAEIEKGLRENEELRQRMNNHFPVKETGKKK